MATKQELQEKIKRAEKAIKNPNATEAEKKQFQNLADKFKKELAETGGAASGDESAEIQKMKEDIANQEDLIKEGGLAPNIEKMLKKKIGELKDKLAKKEGKAAPAKPAKPTKAKKQAKAKKPAKEVAKKPVAKPKRKPPVKKAKVAAKPKLEKKEPKAKKDYSKLTRTECIKRLKAAEKVSKVAKKHRTERKKAGLPATKTPHEVVSTASKAVESKVKAIVKKTGKITEVEAKKTQTKVADIVETIVNAIPAKADKVEWLKELCHAVLKRCKIKPQDFKMA